MKLFQQQLEIFGRLRVARRNPDIDHLNRAQLFQHRRRGQAGRVNLQTVLQSDLETIGQEGDQNVRVYPALQVVVNGTNAQLTFERSKHCLDLSQLDVACPQHRRVLR